MAFAQYKLDIACAINFLALHTQSVRRLVHLNSTNTLRELRTHGDASAPLPQLLVKLHHKSETLRFPPSARNKITSHPSKGRRTSPRMTGLRGRQAVSSQPKQLTFKNIYENVPFRRAPRSRPDQVTKQPKGILSCSTYTRGGAPRFTSTTNRNPEGWVSPPTDYWGKSAGLLNRDSTSAQAGVALLCPTTPIPQHQPAAAFCRNSVSGESLPSLVLPPIPPGWTNFEFSLPKGEKLGTIFAQEMNPSQHLPAVYSVQDMPPVETGELSTSSYTQKSKNKLDRNNVKPKKAFYQDTKVSQAAFPCYTTLASRKKRAYSQKRYRSLSVAWQT